MGNFDASAGSGEPEVADVDVATQHLFEAKGLRRELDVCRISVAPPDLELDRRWSPQLVELDGIGPASETEPLRPERERPDHEAARIGTTGSRIMVTGGNAGTPTGFAAPRARDRLAASSGGKRRPG